ncbi:antibiotic biosynthesis monooxygenase family protein [Paenibacillus periandrae]|uniref:antibiotic biosynthesis monooxygenase family protein n=1 Tax=Paenibacillus periandrae TaxID=1761741 RepID=UPI001F08B38C|nr:antibiotic biosynthesis monooxygenase [Paenibacillus periandrae]
MILEVVMLQVKVGMEEEYEDILREAYQIISQARGFISLELKRCIEIRGKYLLFTKWETLEDHIIGFRQSLMYQEWMALLHHFYELPLIVEHFENVDFKEWG